MSNEDLELDKISYFALRLGTFIGMHQRVIGLFLIFIDSFFLSIVTIGAYLGLDRNIYIHSIIPILIAMIFWFIMILGNILFLKSFGSE